MVSFLVRAELSLSTKDRAALKVGQQIQAIQESIQNPKISGAIRVLFLQHAIRVTLNNNLMSKVRLPEPNEQ